MDKKVLIVEDDAVLRKALKEFLSEEGFQVETASNGEEGVEMALKGGSDIVLLDIILPKKDGYTVIKEIRSNQSTKDVPIVLLTNLGSLNDVEKALSLGATTYLVKSDYKLEEISTKIKNILEI